MKLEMKIRRLQIISIEFRGSLQSSHFNFTMRLCKFPGKPDRKQNSKKKKKVNVCMCVSVFCAVYSMIYHSCAFSFE